MRCLGAIASLAIIPIAACFSTPGFSGGTTDGGDDGSSGSELALHVNGTDPASSAIVTGPDLRLAFAKDFGKMPSSLKSTSSNNEWLSFVNTSYYERGIGVELEDSYIIGPLDGKHTGTVTAFTVLESGPARAKIRITWGGPTACAQDSGTLGGNTTTFTIYPDGRIARHDEIVAVISATDCGGFVGLFHSFDGAGRSFYEVLDGDVSAIAVAVPPDPQAGQRALMAGLACLRDADAAVGTTFTKPVSDSEWSFFETSRNTEGNININYMVNENETIVPGHRYVADTLTALRPTTCEDLRASVFEPYAQHPLTANTMWVPEDAGYRIDPGMSSLRTNVALPSGTAFLLQGRQSITRVTLDGRTLTAGRDYLSQAPAADEIDAVVWLAVPVNKDATLAFEGT